MILVDASGVAMHRPGKALFEDLSITVSSGDRLGVVGINGGGKSTLLKVLAGTREPEAGTLRRGRGTRVSMLDQDVPLAAGTVARAFRELEAEGGVVAGARTGWARSGAAAGEVPRRVSRAFAGAELGPGSADCGIGKGCGVAAIGGTLETIGARSVGGAFASSSRTVLSLAYFRGESWGERHPEASSDQDDRAQRPAG